MGFLFIAAFPLHFDKLPWWFYRHPIYTLSVPYLYICPSAQHYDSNQGSNTENSHWNLKRPSHGTLKLANSSWCVWTALKQSAKKLANCWPQIERVCRLFLRRSHPSTWVCQYEFANFSLPCRGRLTHWTTGPPTTPPYPQQMPPLTHVCSQYECSLRKFET